MTNTWDVNKKLNLGKKVQPILGSGTKGRKRSYLPTDDSSQNPTPNPIINEVSHLGCGVCKSLKKKKKKKVLSKSIMWCCHTKKATFIFSEHAKRNCLCLSCGSVILKRPPCPLP